MITVLFQSRNNAGKEQTKIDKFQNRIFTYLCLILMKYQNKYLKKVICLSIEAIREYYSGNIMDLSNDS